MPTDDWTLVAAVSASVSLLGLTIWFIFSRLARQWRKRRRWSRWDREEAAAAILDASQGYHSVACTVSPETDQYPHREASWWRINHDGVAVSGLLISTTIQEAAQALVADFGSTTYMSETGTWVHIVPCLELQEVAGQQERPLKRQLLAILGPLAFLFLFLSSATVLIAAIHYHFDPAAQSDAFFARLADGQAMNNQLRAELNQEQRRLTQILVLAKSKDKPAAQEIVKFSIRLAIVEILLSDGRGSPLVDQLLDQAESTIVNAANAAAKGTLDGYAESLADINRERGFNRFLLGDETAAIEFLQKALGFAKNSSYADTYREASIHEQLAHIHYQAKRWQETLRYASQAVYTIRSIMALPPDVAKRALRQPLKYKFVAACRTGANAEVDFDSLMRLAGKDFSAIEAAKLHHEISINITQRAEQSLEKAQQRAMSIKSEAARKVALQQAEHAYSKAWLKSHSKILRAQELVNASYNAEDASAKFAIYLELAASYARKRMRQQAAVTYRMAIDLGISALGKNAPELLAPRQQYANLLEGLGRTAEALEERNEIERLERH